MPLYGLNIKGTRLLRAVGDLASIMSLEDEKHKLVTLKSVPAYTRVYAGGKSYYSSIFQREGNLISDEVYYLNPVGVTHTETQQQIIVDFKSNGE